MREEETYEWFMRWVEIVIVTFAIISLDTTMLLAQLADLIGTAISSDLGLG